MNSENYFKDMFESNPDYSKTVLLIFLIKIIRVFRKKLVVPKMLLIV